ncbi:EcsC family protein [Paenibacillus thalictri]|uniref:EcsC family protein n=1 Tax=Paenibacillus thalictri TaxID=2527873 RepID=A0A4Q9DQD2_9BACL|nr:EcsC family protein [Paenibacillus thalictri]TBL76296.1 EcsC family protein [Paenibacillus thalictri]
MSNETKEKLELELRKIAQWEREQKDLWWWEKLGRLPFLLLDKITPKVVQEKIGLALDELGSFVQIGGQYLISKHSVLEQLECEALKVQPTPGELNEPFDLQHVANLPLSVMDQAADALMSSRTRIATLQGAATGFGGIFTLVIDIPALLGISLKVLQEIALCYGYDPQEKRERLFVVKALQFASSDFVGKRTILEELGHFTEEDRNRQMITELQGWREVVATYRDNFGWKKLFQMVPIAGLVFGAIVNRGTLQDVAETGKMLYRKRRINERLSNLDKAQK